MRKVIINGANGYVASHFVDELLANDYEVIAFVRETSVLSSEERMRQALAEIGSEANHGNLKVYNYSLLAENYGLVDEQLTEIFNGDIEFFHFAACLKFKSRDRAEIFRTNVEGVENTIRVFLNYASTASRFFFVSTAYSCGKTSEPFSEEFYENAEINQFRNYYEQSKRFAENTIKESIERNNLNAHVIRLSQVVGNNKSGVTKTNYGIFDFIKKIQTFSENYPNKTIRIQIDPDSTQNLIPIDNVVSYFMKVLEKDDIPIIFNFVARKPVKNNQIISSVCEVLPVEIVQKKELNREELSRMERMIAAGMSFTGVYANINLKFDTKNLEKTVSPNGNEITPESLHNMIEYFVEQESEKKAELNKT